VDKKTKNPQTPNKQGIIPLFFSQKKRKTLI